MEFRWRCLGGCSCYSYSFDCLHGSKVTVTPHAGNVYSLMFMHEHALCFHAVYVHVLQVFQVEALTVLLISMLHLTGITLIP